MATVYKIDFGTGKLKPMTEDGKDDLEVGRILQMRGYDNPQFIITGKTGRFGGGTRYQVVNLDTHRFRIKDAYELMFISEKKDNRIQTYITDKIKTPDEVAALIAEALANEKADEKARAEAKAKVEADVARGRALLANHIPPAAKALLIACHDKDDSDLMTDYFAHTTTETVVIGWSKHMRDDFREMRKAAALFPETAHLATGSESVEHREKWSMGNGYYLKDGSSNSTGWAVHKVKKYGADWPDDLAASMAKRCIF